jgi:hypothetical protein
MVELSVRLAPFAVFTHSMINYPMLGPIHGCLGSGETLFILHDLPQKITTYDVRTHAFSPSDACLLQASQFLFCESCQKPSLILFGLNSDPMDISFANRSSLSVRSLLTPFYFTAAVADDFGVFFLACNIDGCFIVYTPLSEIPLQRPQVREFGRSSVVLTVAPLFRWIFTRSAAVVLATGEKVALLRLPVPQIVQFVLPPLHPHTAFLEVLYDAACFRSPPLEFIIPLADLPQCRHFSVFALDSDTVRLEWRRPDGISGTGVIEAASESDEWTPLLRIADGEKDAVHLRVGPGYLRFRIYIIDEYGNKGIPATVERKKFTGGKPRQQFTDEQSQFLVTFFEGCANPTRAQREQLAYDLHIPLQSITYWFQNSRKRRTL